MSDSDKDRNGEGAEPRDATADGAANGDRALSEVEVAKELARKRAEERKARRAAKRRERGERIRSAGGNLRSWRAHRERRQRDRGPKPKLKKLRIALVTVGLGLLAIVSWVFGVMMAVAQDLPELEARSQYEQAANSIVYASDGKTELATLTGNEKRILLESEEISPALKQAVVAIEDERFYEHRGIDYVAIARALQQDILAGSAVQGGSTITQQFVKNALEAQGDRTVLQKLREAAIAYQIERRWSKDKILTNYLNNIYFGHGAYGVEAAARTYFGWNHSGCGEEENRCATLLQPEEAAMLAALISSPTAYDPATNPIDAKAQRNVVLQKMYEQGTLQASEEEYQAMLDSEIPEPDDIEPPKEESKAPYFTDWLRQQVVDKYGPGQAFGGGLKVTSTLDLELQQAAEDAVAGRLGGLGPTSAVVVIENGTGNVLAMVGGQDFDKAPFNLATNGQRQPGSSFKPFTLVTALKEGHSPEETFTSAPQEIPFEATIRKDGERKVVQDIFRVNNYDDNYLGTASIASATTYSDNAVYAQLGMEVGLNDVVDTARDLGITSQVDDNPAMILGGLEYGVTPLEMAYAYNTLANGGERVSGTMASKGNGVGPVAIEKVEAENDDGDMEPVADDEGATGVNEKTGKQVVDEGVASTATELLHSVVTSGTGERAQVGDDYIWGKTGTTDNNADAWFVGANEEVTVAVWVGYADGATPMETEFAGLPVDGGTIPALIWADVVSAYDAIAAGDEDAAVDSTEVAPATTAVPETTVVPEATTPVAPAPVPEEPVVPEATAPPATEPTEPVAPDTGGTSAGGLG